MKHLVLLLSFLMPFSVQAGENLLVPMVGFSSWSDNSGHTARGAPITFEDDNEFTLGFKYLYMFDSGLALGGNLYLYDKNVTTAVQASDSGVLHIHGLVQYYFNSSNSVSPFIGAGIGVSAIGFDGGLLDGDGTGGASVELNGGVLFRVSERIGIQLEYKYTDFDMDEDIDGLRTNIETSAHSVLVGVSIHI